MIDRSKFFVDDMVRRCNYLLNNYEGHEGTFQKLGIEEDEKDLDGYPIDSEELVIGRVRIGREIYEGYAPVIKHSLVVYDAKTEVLVHDSEYVDDHSSYNRILMFPGHPEKGLVKLTVDDYLPADNIEEFVDDLYEREARGDIVIFHDDNPYNNGGLMMRISERTTSFIPGSWCRVVNNAYHKVRTAIDYGHDLSSPTCDD